MQLKNLNIQVTFLRCDTLKYTYTKLYVTWIVHYTLIDILNIR